MELSVVYHSYPTIAKSILSEVQAREKVRDKTYVSLVSSPHTSLEVSLCPGGMDS